MIYSHTFVPVFQLQSGNGLRCRFRTSNVMSHREFTAFSDISGNTQLLAVSGQFWYAWYHIESISHTKASFSLQEKNYSRRAGSMVPIVNVTFRAGYPHPVLGSRGLRFHYLTDVARFLPPSPVAFDARQQHRTPG